ncbi:MAG TPA: S8 family serine peptidase [Gemmatimonadales bacterium]
MPWIRCSLLVLMLTLACAPKQPEPESPPPKPNIDPGRVSTKAPETPPPGKEPDEEEPAQPMVPPEAAYSHGWMALGSTGVENFLQQHPTFDGRGVLIGILDTGIDPGIQGLLTTSTDTPKLLDLRDFSHEGSVPLRPVTPVGDSIEIGGHRLRGFGRVAAVSTGGPYYGGTIAELPLGEPPASDLNGNGNDSDTLPLVVTRATDGWVLFADTDGDGSLAGERPVHDYLVSRESFGWARRGRAPGMNLAANFSANGKDPQLDLVFDSYSHGSHVAGIAAGHDMYGVTGFNGVAPGAQLLGLKIANSAQGSITTSGSLVRAVEYAIQFAQTRRLPLVLNLSFGVGNEVEGTARIDGIIDSILAANPALVFTISAGNDGPGLSTMGFPGSARRSISVGATLPSTFLPPNPNGGSHDDLLAYFSSRGGEVAKPDLIAPGVAYSTVPRWNTGHEIEQGTSMASPHAAGLAALLVSQLVQEKKPINGGEIKQALMVTARPLPGATPVDEGTGLPQVAQAAQWLSTPRTIADIAVRALSEEGRPTAGLHQKAPSDSIWVQRFELTRSDSAARQVYSLRSDASWASAPAKVTFTGRTATVDVRYRVSGLKTPGGYTATVSGWSADSLAGPAFRLVTTVIAPEAMASTTRELRSAAPLDAGSELRSFFSADSARPFELRISSASVGQKGLAFLHEPDGMPYRDEYTRPIGSAEREAVYLVDARDVVPGAYQAVVVAPTAQRIAVNVKVTQSPLRLQLGREKDRAVARLTNLTTAPIRTDLALLLGGGERIETVVARGSGVREIPFVAPAWAKAVVVDLSMERAQWSRFTDFGVTLFDSVGRQIEKQPLNYAFGRLQAKLPDDHGTMPIRLALFPGFADPNGEENWTLRASIRLYADSAVALDPATPADSALTLAPGKSSSVGFTLSESPWPLGDGFFPLGVLVARAEEHSWTREGGLPLPNPPMMR